MVGPRRLTEPDLVEHARGDRRDDVRHDPGNRRQGSWIERQRIAAPTVPQLIDRRVITAGQDRAPERSAPRQPVDPRDRVPVAVVPRRHACHDVVQICGPLRVDPHARGLDRQQSERGARDHTREPHPAHGPGERVRIARDRHRSVGTVCRHEIECEDVVADPAIDVMVLAMHVVRDRASERDEAGTGRDGQEPSARHDAAQDGVERRSGERGDRPRPIVERFDTGEGRSCRAPPRRRSEPRPRSSSRAHEGARPGGTAPPARPRSRPRQAVGSRWLATERSAPNR